MAELLPWLVASAGWPRWRCSSPSAGWVGFPFLIVTSTATLAAGISPLVEEVVELDLGGSYTRMRIPGYYSDELPGAIGLVLLSYGSLVGSIHCQWIAFG